MNQLILKINCYWHIQWKGRGLHVKSNVLRELPTLSRYICAVSDMHIFDIILLANLCLRSLIQIESHRTLFSIFSVSSITCILCKQQQQQK